MAREIERAARTIKFARTQSVTDVEQRSAERGENGFAAKLVAARWKRIRCSGQRASRLGLFAIAETRNGGRERCRENGDELALTVSLEYYTGNAARIPERTRSH